MVAELKPCPFCGGTDAFVERLDYSAAYVQCDSRIDEHCACLARGPVGVQDDDGEEIPGAAAAIRAWNNRAPHPAEGSAHGGHEGAARTGQESSETRMDAGFQPLPEVGVNSSAQPSGDDGLPPVEYDRAMDRTYIPLPGSWEIQTKGNGSTFRIANALMDSRWLVLDENLHEVLEALARDTRTAIASRDEEIADLRSQLAEARQEITEQCRIIGMGAEREASLMAQLARQGEPVAWMYKWDKGNSLWPAKLDPESEEYFDFIPVGAQEIPLYASSALSHQEEKGEDSAENGSERNGNG